MRAISADIGSWAGGGGEQGQCHLSWTMDS